MTRSRRFVLDRHCNHASPSIAGFGRAGQLTGCDMIPKAAPRLTIRPDPHNRSGKWLLSADALEGLPLAGLRHSRCAETERMLSLCPKIQRYSSSWQLAACG